jgi:ribosomal protein S18 acetylase RimI-like enzyme
MTHTALSGTRVSLRSVTDADRTFLIELYGSTRDEELSRVAWPEGQRAAFVLMQFEAQDTQYRANNPQASFDVIEVDGERAGRLYVDRRANDVRIIDVALLPGFRGRGVGGRLLVGLLEEAAATGRTASVHVEIHNRAASLYTRLGFVAVSERGLHRLMEWSAP